MREKGGQRSFVDTLTNSEQRREPIALPFVGRDDGSRRRTRQGANGSEKLNRQSAEHIKQRHVLLGRRINKSEVLKLALQNLA